MTADLAAPPASIDAERRVLGTLIVFYTREAVEAVKATGLKPGDFYWSAHEAVYRAVLKLSDGGWVDTLTMARFLAAQRHGRSGNWLERVGGRARLEELAGCADANGLRECARMVAEDGRWRRWLDATTLAVEHIHDRDEAAFWAAIGRIRDDVLPGELRLVAGEEKAA